MTALWQRGALELAEKIRSKELSSREILDTHLARADAVDRALDAVVRLLADDPITA